MNGRRDVYAETGGALSNNIGREMKEDTKDKEEKGGGGFGPPIVHHGGAVRVL